MQPTDSLALNIFSSFITMFLVFKIFFQKGEWESTPLIALLLSSALGSLITSTFALFAARKPTEAITVSSSTLITGIFAIILTFRSFSL